MRFLALFFSLYFAVLACLPCADEAVARPLEPMQTTVAASTHAGCHSEALGDWCSPLCQCRCCAGATLPGATLRLPTRAVATHPGVVRAVFVVAAPTRGTTAVWQPPRA
ncbi:DUF6660 family protein [Hymenobacter coalescens]